MEQETGSIEVGKKADIIVFPDNLHQLDMESISEITPILSVFDGKIVFDGKE